MSRLPIVDADAHVYEPNTMWVDYVSAEFKDRAPRIRPPSAPRTASLSWSRDVELLTLLERSCQRAGLSVDEIMEWINSGVAGLLDLYFEDQPIWEGLSEGARIRGAAFLVANHIGGFVSGFSAESHVRVLKRQGVVRAHLHPSSGLWVLAIDTMEPALATALARAYNDWLRDFCSHDSSFLQGIGAIAPHEPAAMVAEVERVAGWGFRAVTLRPNPVCGRMLGHPDYAPFWAACERLDVAVTLHEGSHARTATAGADRFTTQFGRHACSHPMEHMMAMASLIESGVLHRHPKLRVGFMEAGCGWLPYWLWRLDEMEYASLGWEVGDRVQMKPSDYFRRQCFIAVEPSEPCVEQVIDLFGEGCVVYGTDYPHTDHKLHASRDLDRLIERLGRPVAEKIVWSNANRLFGMSD